MCDEQFRNFVPLVENADHERLTKLVQSAGCNCGRRCHSLPLAGEASLAEELTGTQQGKGCFSALFGNDRELHPAASEVQNGIRGLPLLKDLAVGDAFNGSVFAREFGEKDFPWDCRPAFPGCPPCTSYRHP